MNGKVLCVDDDHNILQAYKRILHKDFAIETAGNGQLGLEAVRAHGPFAVVVSDLRMPGMDGVQFLAAVRECAPKTVRVMLTGQADLITAIAAVNEGHIFRFLTKPCSPDTLGKALRAALEQYHLITAERVLLKKTLTGSIQVLTEILSLVNPTAFGHASRIQRYVQHMVKELRLSNGWEIEIAGMLSQIGCVTLPTELLDKVHADQALSSEEQEMFAAHPTVAGTLLAKIPRLETVARMIEGLQQPIDLPALVERLQQGDTTGLGTQMLLVALDFDRLITRGISPTLALAKMKQRKDRYLPSLLTSLANVELDSTSQTTKVVQVHALRPGMILDEDLYARNDTLLLAKGHQITPSIIMHLNNFARTIGIVEPFRVFLPREIPEANAPTVGEAEKGGFTYAA